MRKYGTAKNAFFDVGIPLLLEHGYEALKVTQICEASETSNGSFFHHFGSKKRFAAELYAKLLDDYHQAVAEAVADNPGLKQGISQLITCHMNWVIDNADKARFLLEPPAADILETIAADITELNAEFHRQVADWYAPCCKAEGVKPIEDKLFYFQVIGPCQMYCRSWLAGKDKRRPDDHLDQLIAFAVRALV